MHQAVTGLDALEEELLATGVADFGRAFNLTWHDWLNLRSQIEISRVIAHAALKRENSCGAHFREDFPDAGDLAASRYTLVQVKDNHLEVTDAPVIFSMIKPGETLLTAQDAAE